jgi:hypothetical protein
MLSFYFLNNNASKSKKIIVKIIIGFQRYLHYQHLKNNDQAFKCLLI